MSYNWQWNYVNTKDPDYAFGDLVGECILLGTINDEDASYEHTEHRFYYNPETNKFIYVYSAGCSCWDSSDAVNEWDERVEFNNRQEFIAYLKSGEYSGHTIYPSMIEQIEEDIMRSPPDTFYTDEENNQTHFIL